MTELMDRLRRPRRLAALAGRWRRDERGTSMITTAVTLPVLVVIFLGIFWVGLFMYGRWMLRQGTNEAAQYISEQGRYWNINPAAAPEYPIDWYDFEAKRLIGSRLRDVLGYSPQVITDTLVVTVTEPAIALNPEGDPVCVPGDRAPGDYRTFDDTKFLVEATWDVPYWSVRLPFDFEQWDRSLTFHERAIGHIQCPRWTGQGGGEDKSRTYGAQGPALPYGSTPGPLPSIVVPTVTEAPTLAPTEVPTETPTP